ncbi:MAG: GTPase [Phycisphaerae bacterium]
MTPRDRVILLTPPGTGALAVMRVIGPDAATVVDAVFRAARGTTLSRTPRNRLRYGRLVDGDETIDDVVASVERIGTETAVDICLHGGVRVVQRALTLMERAGARVTNPHETSTPPTTTVPSAPAVPTTTAPGAPAAPPTTVPGALAVPPAPSAPDATAGGLAIAGLRSTTAAVWPADNAIERDAVDAMTHAATTRGLRFLSCQRRTLVDAVERVAARCDDDPARAAAELDAMLMHHRTARRLVHGATVAIVGPPNTGKSTLFNRLLGRTAAIVAAHAGTTRDWVTGRIEIDGVPITLVDTAGGRGDAGALEAEAIRAGRRIAARCDLILVVLDGARALPPPGDAIKKWRAVRPPDSAGGSPSRHDTSARVADTVMVINKRDLPAAWHRDVLPAPEAARAVELSAKRGSGMDRVRDAVLSGLGFAGWNDEAACVFSDRQIAVCAMLVKQLRDGGRDMAAAIRSGLIGRAST